MNLDKVCDIKDIDPYIVRNGSELVILKDGIQMLNGNLGNGVFLVVINNSIYVDKSVDMTNNNVIENIIKNINMVKNVCGEANVMDIKLRGPDRVSNTNPLYNTVIMYGMNERICDILLNYVKGKRTNEIN